MGYYGGATAIGIKSNSGVVLAAERRFSHGGYILSRATRKVFKITDRIAFAGAGLVADIQAMNKIIQAEIKYYEVSMGRPISIRSAAKLISSILYSYKNLPMLSELIIGGVDYEGYHLYVMDPLGSLIEDEYAAIGSGAPIAIGIIENSYKPDLNPEQMIDLAIRAVKMAISRDAMSGDGIDVILITSEKTLEKFIKIS